MAKGRRYTLKTRIAVLKEAAGLICRHCKNGRLVLYQHHWWGGQITGRRSRCAAACIWELMDDPERFYAVS